MTVKFGGPNALDVRYDAHILSHMENLDDIDRDELITRGLCHKADLELEVFFPVDEVAFTNSGSRQPNRSDRRWRKAEEICAQCPVRIQCLAYAVANPRIAVAGVWGGRHLADRNSIIRALGRR